MRCSGGNDGRVECDANGGALRKRSAHQMLLKKHTGELVSQKWGVLEWRQQEHQTRQQKKAARQAQLSLRVRLLIVVVAVARFAVVAAAAQFWLEAAGRGP